MSKAKDLKLTTEVTIWREEEYEIRIRCDPDGSYYIIQGDESVYLNDDLTVAALIAALKELVDQ